MSDNNGKSAGPACAPSNSGMQGRYFCSAGFTVFEEDYSCLFVAVVAVLRGRALTPKVENAPVNTACSLSAELCP